MSEEFKNETRNECVFKFLELSKFLVVALGVFVGVYCALCLFVLVHRPPLTMQPPMPPMNPYFNQIPMNTNPAPMPQMNPYFNQMPMNINPAPMPPMPPMSLPHYIPMSNIPFNCPCNKNN